MSSFLSPNESLTKDKILFDLYFLMFNSPEKSRFTTFFNHLSKKNKITAVSKRPSLNIYPEKIVQGLDKRTSIVLYNIPKTWSKKSLRSIAGSFGNINYLYIVPGKNNKPMSSVYINYINYKSIINAYMTLRKIKFQIEKKSIYIIINYSKIQGKKELIKMFSEKKY